MNQLNDGKTASPSQKPVQKTGLDRLCRSGRARQNTYTSESRRNSLQRNTLLKKEDSAESNSSSTSSSTQLSIFGSLNRDESRATPTDNDTKESGPDTRQTSIASDEQNDKKLKRRSSSHKRSFDEIHDNPSLFNQPQQSRKQLRTSDEQNDRNQDKTDSRDKGYASSNVPLNTECPASTNTKVDLEKDTAQHTVPSTSPKPVSTAREPAADNNEEAQLHDIRRDSTHPLHDLHMRLNKDASRKEPMTVERVGTPQTA